MKDLYFTSALSVDYRAALEGLMFFNQEQQRLRPDIIRSIERFGHPEIIDCNGHLRVVVGKCPEVQSLHALASGLPRPRLAGTLVYLRESMEDLTIIHIAVAPSFVASRDESGLPLAMRLLNEVVRIAKRVKGIRSVELPYCGGKHSRISVANGLPFA